ncbi:hypothetical protein [Enterococcus sp. DIV1420a]|uniref:hypothetical protein n=1 Tax=Enterococcus sp. DIV1420a TaxID=2774672 RepID=UPI003F22FFC9
MRIEEKVENLESLSNRIDLMVNYLSCLSGLLSQGENTLVIYSLSGEKGLSNLTNNLEDISEEIVKVASFMEVVSQ